MNYIYLNQAFQYCLNNLAYKNKPDGNVILCIHTSIKSHFYDQSENVISQGL